MADKVLPTVVVGGGIGGLATALALARIGRPVHVLERSDSFTEIGAGLQLGPNAVRVLDDWGLLEAVDAASVRLRRAVLLDALSGEPLTVLDFGPAFLERYGHPYLVLHRADLLATLHDACLAAGCVTLEAGRDVVATHDEGDVARVVCADGTEHVAEAVVAADGLWSRTREAIVGDTPICARYVAYRGTAPPGDAVDLEDDTEMIWIGPGMHFVQYRIRQGELVNRVGVFRSARYREDDDTWGGAEELDAAVRDACPAVQTVAGTLGRDRRWPMYDRLPTTNWTRGRITLLGDAAHPMLQYLAQGACQALEDAHHLARSFEVSEGDVARAFARYQSARIPRTAEVQRNARIWGELWHSDDYLVRGLRDRLFRLRAPDDYSETDWLYARP